MHTPNFSSRWFLTPICTAAVLVVLGSFALAAQAAGPSEPAEEAPMSAEAALKVLLGDAAPSLPRPVAQQVETFAIPPRAETPAAVSALKVVVKPGETVDGLLRRHLGDSAFSMKFQRQALVRLNPSAFPRGLVQRLAVGTTLWMPTDPIMAGMVPGGRKDSTLAQAASAANPSATAGQPVHTPSPTRGWVRFP
jgi:hypothetical protein